MEAASDQKRREIVYKYSLTHSRVLQIFDEQFNLFERRLKYQSRDSTPLDVYLETEIMRNVDIGTPYQRYLPRWQRKMKKLRKSLTEPVERVQQPPIGR